MTKVTRKNISDSPKPFDMSSRTLLESPKFLHKSHVLNNKNNQKDNEVVHVNPVRDEESEKLPLNSKKNIQFSNSEIKISKIKPQKKLSITSKSLEKKKITTYDDDNHDNDNDDVDTNEIKKKKKDASFQFNIEIDI